MVTPELLSEVRKGGFVLYMRHGTTDNSRADRAPSVDLNDCNTQRVLNDEGRKLAIAIGQSFIKAKIPVGEVFTARCAGPAKVRNWPSPPCAPSSSLS